MPTDVVIRYIGYGGQWDPTGAPWAPLGPLGPLGVPLGPLGPRGPPGAPNPLLWVPIISKPGQKINFFAFLGKIAEKKGGIQAPGPPRRDPGRNSVPDPSFKVPNGGMATHLVAKRCDLGSLGVPGPARTPCWRAGGGRAVAPTPTLVSTHPRLLSPCWGGSNTINHQLVAVLDPE